MSPTNELARMSHYVFVIYQVMHWIHIHFLKRVPSIKCVKVSDFLFVGFQFRLLRSPLSCLISHLCICTVATLSKPMAKQLSLYGSSNWKPLMDIEQDIKYTLCTVGSLPLTNNSYLMRRILPCTQSWSSLVLCLHVLWKHIFFWNSYIG